MTHTFLERSELVPVVITSAVRRNKELDNKTTSFRVILLLTKCIVSPQIQKPRGGGGRGKHKIDFCPIAVRYIGKLSSEKET